MRFANEVHKKNRLQAKTAPQAASNQPNLYAVTTALFFILLSSIKIEHSILYTINVETIL
ncbi:MAG: hypothetical protein ACJAWA_001573 [Nonlabens sp.]